MTNCHNQVMIAYMEGTITFSILLSLQHCRFKGDIKADDVDGTITLKSSSRVDFCSLKDFSLPSMRCRWNVLCICVSCKEGILKTLWTRLILSVVGECVFSDSDLSRFIYIFFDNFSYDKVSFYSLPPHNWLYEPFLSFDFQY